MKIEGEEEGKKIYMTEENTRKGVMAMMIIVIDLIDLNRDYYHNESQ